MEQIVEEMKCRVCVREVCKLSEIAYREPVNILIVRRNLKNIDIETTFEMKIYIDYDIKQGKG